MCLAAKDEKKHRNQSNLNIAIIGNSVVKQLPQMIKETIISSEGSELVYWFW